MLEGPLVFVDVDTQRDFLEREGALFIPGSEAILENLERLTTFARELRIPVIATACAHEAGDQEFGIFPQHCLIGSPGQRRVAETSWSGSRVIGASERFSGAIPPHLTLEKREYDISKLPEFDTILSMYQAGCPTFVVYGVATDYCVRGAVLGLLKQGCRVSVVVDSVRAIDAGNEGEVLTEFTRAGACLTLAEVVCDAEKSF